jgi:hypothetical protein
MSTRLSSSLARVRIAGARYIRADAADESKLVPLRIEAGIEKFWNYAADEVVLYGAIFAPTEVA